MLPFLQSFFYPNKMADYYIYASDYSVSTKGQRYYNENAMKTLDTFRNDVNKYLEKSKKDAELVYLQWGDDCIHVNEKKIAQTYRRMDGNSRATKPAMIINWIKNNMDRSCNIKLLYIVTDGSIIPSSVDECVQLNVDMMYEEVVYFAFNEIGRYINMSVGAAFFKKKCTVICNNDVVDKVDISVEYDYDHITINNFLEEKDSLISYIKLKFITSNKSNQRVLHEIDKLKKLRTRLFAEHEASDRGKQVNPKSMSEIKDKIEFVQAFKDSAYYKELYDDASLEIKVEIEKCVSTLLNYLNLETKSYEFDALKYDNKYTREEVVEELDIDVNFAEEDKIEFPDVICFDDSKNVPVIALAVYNLPKKIIFHSDKITEDAKIMPASFSKFKTIIECPLFLLSDKDFVDNSICYFYTLDVYHQLLETSSEEIMADPHTRRSFKGAIVLSQEFDKYNDYILAESYFDSKKIKYNKGLLYYVLWKICEGKEWMNRNVVDKFKSYMLRRVAETECTIGLSTLPLDPQIRVTLPAALWYCVELSSLIFKDDDKHYSKERLRMYSGIAEFMIEILTCLGYDLDLDFINARMDMMKHVNTLKRIQTTREKYYYMARKIFKEIDGFLIAKMKNQENVKKLNYLKLSHMGKLNRNVLDDDLDLESYVHFLHSVHLDGDKCDICPETFRPYFVIKQNDSEVKSFYYKLVEKTKCVVVNKVNGQYEIEYHPATVVDFQRIPSLYKIYVNYVKENNQYPTLTEYKDYVLKTKKFVGDKPVIFGVGILSDIEFVHSGYERAKEGIDVSEFVKRSYGSVNRLDRIKMELVKLHIPLLKTDHDIEEFIRKQDRVLLNK